MYNKALRYADLMFLMVMFISMHSVIASLVAQTKGFFPCLLCEIQRAALLLIFSFSISGVFSLDKKRYLLFTEVLSGFLIFFSSIHIAALYSVIPDPCKWLMRKTINETDLTIANCSDITWEPFGMPAQIGSCVIGICLFIGIRLARKKLLLSAGEDASDYRQNTISK